MKLAVILAAGIFIGGCQTSYMVSGDKDLSEIKSADDLFKQQISFYQDKIDDLKGNNEYLRMTSPSSKDIARNDSLISQYQQKMLEIEDISNSFLTTTALKDKKSRIELNGSEPREMAEAYLLVAYADNLKNNQNSSIIRSDMKGLIINSRNESVSVKVSGPGLQQYLIIKARGKQVINIPLPGTYCITFISTRNSGNSATVLKEVGPTHSYKDEEGGVFSLIAIATARF